MPKQKAVFATWSNIGVADINRLLRPFDVRLVKKQSKEWGDQISLTAHPIEGGRADPAIAKLSAQLHACIAAIARASTGDLRWTYANNAAAEEAANLLKELGLYQGTPVATPQPAPDRIGA